MGAFVALLLLLLSCRTAEAGFVNLTWDRNPEPDVIGYIVLFGTSSGIYTRSINVGNATAWTISGLNDEQQYYFVVQAYTMDGLTGEFSNEVSATVLPVVGAQLVSPVSGSTLTGRTSEFSWTSGGDGSTYRLTVGTTLGGADIFDSGITTSLSVTATRLPTNCGAVYVRLWTLSNGQSVSTDYSYLTTAITLIVPAAIVNAGGTIIVTVSNAPGNPTDWVGLYVPGADDTAFLTRAYLNGALTPPAAGESDATLGLAAPLIL
jgi:hypothetical protein